MEYILMTVEEAKKMAKKDAVVLVAVNDLENPKDINEFSKKRFFECEKMIKEAETIASVCDDFIKQLRCYTERQDVFPDIKLKGKESVILLREQTNEQMFDKVVDRTNVRLYNSKCKEIPEMETENKKRLPSDNVVAATKQIYGSLNT